MSLEGVLLNTPNAERTKLEPEVNPRPLEGGVMSIRYIKIANSSYLPELRTCELGFTYVREDTSEELCARDVSSNPTKYEWVETQYPDRVIRPGGVCILI